MRPSEINISALPFRREGVFTTGSDTIRDLDMHKGIAQSFLTDESGATAIEYALIAGIVSICMAAALMQISGTLQGMFTRVGSYFVAANQ